MDYSMETICGIVGGQFYENEGNALIQDLVFDSRRVARPSLSLFFALRTPHRDGHQFLEDAYRKGIRNFMVAHPPQASKLYGSTIILVPDALAALQILA